jgi:hypothetical protein
LADTIIPQPGNPMAWDRYSYGLNNPLRYTDPTGHSFWDTIFRQIYEFILLSHTVHISGGGYGSLGTVTTSYTVLSHNHFPKEPEFIDTSGGSNTNVPKGGRCAIGPEIERLDPSTGIVSYEQETSLITAYNPIPGVTPAPLASQQTIDGILVGEYVDVVYQNETGQLFVGRFQVALNKNGVIHISDPNLIMNEGDSGGGVYYQGELIGNSWSINGAGLNAIAKLPSSTFWLSISSAAKAAANYKSSRIQTKELKD